MELNQWKFLKKILNFIFISFYDFFTFLSPSEIDWIRLASLLLVVKDTIGDVWREGLDLGVIKIYKSAK